MTEGNFVDYVKINVQSGNGGKGSAHFRRKMWLMEDLMEMVEEVATLLL